VGLGGGAGEGAEEFSGGPAEGVGPPGEPLVDGPDEEVAAAVAIEVRYAREGAAEVPERLLVGGGELVEKRLRVGGAGEGGEGEEGQK
jgi:hypothetical protein